MSNLRILVKRNGERVMQINKIWSKPSTTEGWTNIPEVHEEPADPIAEHLSRVINKATENMIKGAENPPPKVRTVAENVRDGVYSDWSRRDTLKKHSDSASECNSKVKPQEFFVFRESIGTTDSVSFSPTDYVASTINYPDKNLIHVTEIPPGCRLVNGHDILKAWNTHQCHFTTITDFNKFLKELGFDNE